MRWPLVLLAALVAALLAFALWHWMSRKDSRMEWYDAHIGETEIETVMVVLLGPAVWLAGALACLQTIKGVKGLLSDDKD